MLFQEFSFWQVLIIAVVSGFICANLAGYWRYSRPHSMLWGWAGFFLGPIGLVLLVLAQIVRALRLV